MKKTSAQKLSIAHDIRTLAEALMVRLAADSMSVTGEPGNVLREMARTSMSSRKLASYNQIKERAKWVIGLASTDDSQDNRKMVTEALRDLRNIYPAGSEESVKIGAQIRIIEEGGRILVGALDI